LLLLEAATFLLAALVHFGIGLTGYEHREASIAESVIAAVLLSGVVLTWVAPRCAILAVLVWGLAFLRRQPVRVMSKQFSQADVLAERFRDLPRRAALRALDLLSAARACCSPYFMPSSFRPSGSRKNTA
jgi:hypothetical protein